MKTVARLGLNKLQGWGLVRSIFSCRSAGIIPSGPGNLKLSNESVTHFNF